MTKLKYIIKYIGSFLEKGLVRVRPKSKKGYPGWNEQSFDIDKLKKNDNVGVLAVEGLTVIDVDVDSLPEHNKRFFGISETSYCYGRPSKRASKYIFQCNTELPYKRFMDAANKTTIIEFRTGTGHLDIIPPSVHPNGEILTWERGESPFDYPLRTVDARKLFRKVQLFATYWVIHRYYNGAGARHDWMLALAGFLRKLKLTEKEVKAIVRLAAEGQDNKIEDRMLEITTTFKRDMSTPVSGGPSLRNLSEEPALFTSLCQIWDFQNFQTTDKGTIIKNGKNTVLALKKLGIEMKFNDFSKDVVLSKENGPWRKLDSDDYGDLFCDIEHNFGWLPNKDTFFLYLDYLARKKKFNPVIEYLESVTWDGSERLETWLIEYGGIEDNEYTRAVCSLTLKAAVARVFYPGCKFDEMLVLESEIQGKSKGSAIEALCPKDEYFTDSFSLDGTIDKVIEGTRGKWLVEASDLDGMTPSKVNRLKAMMSRRVDGPIRLAYKRGTTEVPRQFIFFGTTNSTEYLTDVTGNRRFWPIRLTKAIDVEGLKKIKDLLWAEAVFKLKETTEGKKGSALKEAVRSFIKLDEKLWETAAKHQEERLIYDPWIDILEPYFNDENLFYALRIHELWKLLHMTPRDVSMTASYRIGGVLRTLGFIKVKNMRLHGTQGKTWVKGKKQDTVTTISDILANDEPDFESDD